MDKTQVKGKFYQAVSATLGRPIAGEDRLVDDLNLTSAGYYMVIAEMEELGADEVTYAMIRKCETMEDVSNLLLEQI